MRGLLVEVHHRAWLATALAAVLAAACALLGFPSPAALAAMAAGALLMWISEEERRLLAAMAPGGDPMPAPVLAPVPVRGSATRVREWASPFPAGRPAPRQRPQERRAGRRA